MMFFRAGFLRFFSSDLSSAQWAHLIPIGSCGTAFCGGTIHCRAAEEKKKLCLKNALYVSFDILIYHLEKPHVFLLSKLLKSVLEMLKDIEGAGLEPGTLEHAHISIFLKNNIGLVVWKEVIIDDS